MTMRRIAFLAALGAGIAASAVFSSAAHAVSDDRGMPTNYGPCNAGDLHVQVVKSADHAAGHEAFAVHYTAASAATHCQLAGAPTDAVFFTQAGDPAGGLSAADQPGTADPVTIDATHSAVSYIVEPSAGQQNPVGAVGFMLPSGGPAAHVKVPWTNAPVAGDRVTFSPLTAG